MGLDYQCDFDLRKITHNLGLDEKGRVQQAIDNTFLLGVSPYVPFDECKLISSAIHNTVIGFGLIVWDVENKARRLYYGEEGWNWSHGGIQNGGLRGPYWAQRYIQNGGKEEIRKAAIRAMKR